MFRHSLLFLIDCWVLLVNTYIRYIQINLRNTLLVDKLSWFLFSTKWWGTVMFVITTWFYLIFFWELQSGEHLHLIILIACLFHSSNWSNRIILTWVQRMISGPLWFLRRDGRFFSFVPGVTALWQCWQRMIH